MDYLFHCCLRFLSQLILARADGSNDTTVNEQVGAGNKLNMLTKKEDCCLGNLVARSCALMSPKRIFFPAPIRRTMAVPILPAPKSATTCFSLFLSNIMSIYYLTIYYLQFI